MTAERTASGTDTSLWRRRPPVDRDRATLLTPQHIARVAMGVADAEGLTQVSVRRVAGRLRVPANRLERYLTSRDELHDLMLDELLGEVALPVAGGPWRDQLELITRDTYRVAHEHRCLIELIGARSPIGPNGLRLVEHALAAFEGAAFRSSTSDVRTAALSFNALLAFACGAVTCETRRGGSTRRHEPGDDAAYLTQAVTDGEFPQLRALFAGAPDISTDESFEHGLACLLDGIAARAVTRPERSEPE